MRTIFAGMRIGVLVGSLSPGLVFAQGGSMTPDVDSEIAAVERQIDDAQPQQRARVAEAAIDALRGRWNDPDRYGRLVFTVILALDSTGAAAGPGLARMEQGWVLRALDDPDRLAPQVEIELAMRLRVRITSMPGRERQEERSKLDLLFHAWGTMERETNSKFDGNDLPLENVPPRSFGVPGVDPALISDGRIRDEYLAAIAKNRKKAQEYNLQLFLRRQKAPLLRAIDGATTFALQTGAVSGAYVLDKLGAFRDGDARQHVISVVQALAVR